MSYGPGPEADNRSMGFLSQVPGAAEAMQTRCAEDSQSPGQVWLGRATEHGTPEPDAGRGPTADLNYQEDGGLNICAAHYTPGVIIDSSQQQGRQETASGWI